MELKDKIDKIVKTFNKVFDVYEKRLEYAYESRDKMIEQIRNNETPTGYRYTFLYKSSNRVINLLQDLSEEFNTIHPHDRCTIHDLLDIIETVKFKLKKYADEGD